MPIDRRVAPLVVMLVVAGCSTPERAVGPQPDAPDPRLTGSVLAMREAAVGDSGTLFAVQLPGGQATELQLPPEADLVVDAFWAETGERAHALVETGRGLRLYEVSRSGPARRVGPALEGSADDGVMAAGERVLVTCPGRRGAFVLDLDDPRRWRKVAPGCSAGLSPDGRKVVYSGDGRVVWQRPLEGDGAPRRVVSLAEIARSVGSPRLTLEGEIAWGAQGIALAARSGGRTVIAVVRPDGDIVTERVGGVSERSAYQLRWQPEGPLLGVGGSTGGYVDTVGVVRSLNPASGASRVLSMFTDPFVDVVWSPAGDVFVSGYDEWTFVTPSGRWIDQLPSPRGFPLDWAAAGA